MSYTGSRLYKTLLDEEGIRRAISRISHEIIESNKGVRDLVIIGIHTRGVFIAKRITDIINKFEHSDITPNSIDPKNYRDDIINKFSLARRRNSSTNSSSNSSTSRSSCTGT